MKNTKFEGILPKGPRHAYARQIGPFWQDTLAIWKHFWNVTTVQIILKDKDDIDALYPTHSSTK